MTEFNAQEIIDFLNEKLFEDIDDLARVDGDYNVDLSGMDQYIKKHTEDVRKVERYETMLEEKGKCHGLCRDYPACTMSMTYSCKDEKLLNFEFAHSIEDFR